MIIMTKTIQYLTKYLSALFFCVATSIVLYYSPFWDVKFNAEINASQGTYTQIFYTYESGGYSEVNSVSEVLSPGDNRVSVNIPFSWDRLRWDISGAEGCYIVKNAQLQFMFFSWPVLTKNIQPMNDIQELGAVENGFFVETKSHAVDPVLFLNIDVRKLFLGKLFSAIVISILLIALISFRKTVACRLSMIELKLLNYFKEIQQVLNCKMNFRIHFVLLTAIGCLLYIHFITNFSPSIDDEYASLRVSPDVWIGQGRWSIYLITKFLFVFPAIPFLPYVFFAVCLALSYILAVQVLDKNLDWRLYFLYPIFSFFPSWWNISEFYANVPSVAIGVVATIFATVLIINYQQHHVIQKVITKFDALAIFMLAFAYGTYQSYILLYSALYLAWMIVKFGKEKNCYHLKGYLLRFIVIAFISLTCYFIVNKLFQSIVPSTYGYISGFIRYEEIFLHPSLFIVSFLNQIYSVYFGDSGVYGFQLSFAFLVVFSPFLLISCGKNKLVLVILYILLLFSPFAFNVITGGMKMPLRTMVSLPFIFWFASLMLIKFVRHTMVYILIVTVIGIFQIQMLTITSQYMVAASLTQQNDRIFATILNDEILKVANKKDGASIKVDFYGHKPFKSAYSSAPASTTEASFFDWDNGNIIRMVSYMKMIGYYNFKPVVDINERQKNNEVFAHMPSWPTEGSVMLYNDTVLIKLSEDADPVHEKK